MFVRILQPVACVVGVALLMRSSRSRKELLISDFSSGEYREMETIDDPVMGGSSASAYHVLDGDCLVWEGDVEVVDFLASPGFCILRSWRRQEFLGLGETSGISFYVKTTDASDEVEMLTPMAAMIDTGAKSPFGYRFSYVGVLSERSRVGGVAELYAPWASFKKEFRGREVTGPDLTAEELQKTYRVGLTTYESHTAGHFHVELVKIAAPYDVDSQ